MMRRLLIILWIVAWTNSSYSQNYINSSKSNSKNFFTKYADKNSLKTVIEETDTTLTFLVRDTKVQNLDIFLHFDQKGKCDSEVYTLSCDSCYQKYLNNTLASKQYKWTKVSASTYFSYSRNRLILTAATDKPYSFLIQRSKLNRSEYNKMIKK